MSDLIQKFDNGGSAMKSMLYGNTPSFTTDNHQGEKAVLEFSPNEAEMNKEALQHISGDLYLQESYHVINDYIQHKR
jgi:hypothetical protein